VVLEYARDGLERVERPFLFRITEVAAAPSASLAIIGHLSLPEQPLGLADDGSQLGGLELGHRALLFLWHCGVRSLENVVVMDLDDE
jgi:hypothetical protein